MTEKYKNFINNKWVDPVTEKYFESTSPANNDEIAIVNPTEKFLEVLMKFFRFNDELVEIAIIIKKI